MSYGNPDGKGASFFHQAAKASWAAPLIAFAINIVSNVALRIAAD